MSRSCRGERDEGDVFSASDWKKEQRKREWRTDCIRSIVVVITDIDRCQYRRSSPPLYFFLSPRLLALFHSFFSTTPAPFKQAWPSATLLFERSRDSRCSRRIRPFVESTLSATSTTTTTSADSDFEDSARDNNPHCPSPRRPLLLGQAHPKSSVDLDLVRRGLLRGKHCVPVVWRAGHQ